VTGSVPPVPPPVPPVPPGARKVVILEESSQRTPQQANLYLQLLLSDLKPLILDKDQPSSQKYLKHVQGLPLPVFLVLAGTAEDLVRAVPLPGSLEESRAEVNR
jgi:hypothetical protein